MLPFVISMYSVQTCRPQCFLTQLDHTTGNELHAGSDIWNHGPPPNQEIAAADRLSTLKLRAIHATLLLFHSYQINQNKKHTIILKMRVGSLDSFFLWSLQK